MALIFGIIFIVAGLYFHHKKREESKEEEVKYLISKKLKVNFEFGTFVVIMGIIMVMLHYFTH